MKTKKVIDFSRQKECDNSYFEDGDCDHLKHSHRLFFCIERKPHLVCPYFTIKKGKVGERK